MKRLINVSMILVLLLGFIPQATATAEVVPLWEQLPNGVGDVLSISAAAIYADDFVLTEASSIAQIEIWSRLEAPVQTYYSIHANTIVDEVNVPGESLENGVVTPNVTAEDSSICSHYSCAYRHTLNLAASIGLGAGHYWLSVYGSTYDDQFSWSYSENRTDLPTDAFKPIETGIWDGHYTEALAFRLLEPEQTCPTTVEVANNNDSGVGSLRQAIVDVCPGGTISFDESLSSPTINLSSQLTIDKSLTIDGSEAVSQVILDAGYTDYRVFMVNPGVTATFNSLKISHGNVTDSGGGIYNQGSLTLVNIELFNNSATQYGGGIYNTGNLIVNNSSLVSNSAQYGGGIFNQGGTLAMAGSSMEINAASGQGGAIYNADSTSIVDVVNSTFDGNTAASGGGGAISTGSNTTTTISGCTLVNNQATGTYDSGGGILNGPGATLTVANSTLANNAAPQYGGGICNFGTMNLYNSTLSGNSGHPAGFEGHGLANIESGTLNYANTIIANSPPGEACSNGAAIGTNLNNLVEEGTYDGGCLATWDTDPLLDSLAENGGPTLTMALQAGSGAIDAGDDTICSGTLVAGVDQRGVTRPQGAHCDIGAFELESSDLWQQLPGGESQQVSYAGNQSVYDDFVLTQPATIRQVEFWSSTADPIAINFGFYANNDDGSGHDIPGAGLLLGTTSSIVTTVEDLAVCSQDYCTYRHSFMTYLTLDPGHYWISIYGVYELYWSSAADMTGSFAYYPYEAVSPTLGTGNLAFRLLDYYTPKINTLTIEPSPSMVGMEIWGQVSYSDPDSSSHTGVIDWDDGTVENANYCTSDYCAIPYHTYTAAGTYTIQVWVTDGEGHTGTLSRLHYVSYFMAPPYIDGWLASDVLPTIIELEAYALEGHTPLTFKISVAPEHGSIGTPTSSECEFFAEYGASLCRASVVYTPPTETYNDYDNFSYTIDDGQGNVSPAATVPLWVAPNTPPTAQAATVQVSTILPTTIMLTATDPDYHNGIIDPLNIFISTGPSQGVLRLPEKLYCDTVSDENGIFLHQICNFSIVYTPNAEVTGTTDNFTFSVFDTHQYSLPATVSLELHAPVTWTVNTTEDVVDESGCDESHCSLREAVAAAWNGDIIEFDLAPQTTIVLGGNDIFVDKSLVINGPGADQLTISGGADLEDTEPWMHDRVFTVGGFELPPVTVTINSLTIRDGRADSGGGVIVLEGSNLTINDCVIGPNNIVTYAGGGVFNDRAHLIMNRCTVTGNEGTGSLGGAGVTTAYSGATTTLINSTVSGNITNNYGGGLFVGAECVVSLIHTTVSGNTSNANYMDPYEERGGGAGIYVESGDWSDNQVYLQNSIIAGNTDMTDPVTAGHEKWPDVYGEVTSLGGNLIGDPIGSTNTWDPSDQVGTVLSPLDPMLGLLAWNTPGNTQTMALLAGSPAIDAVISCEVDIDQRGVTRPQPVGGSCDIGAYELVQTVVDTTPPLIAPHDDVTAEATSADGAIVTYISPATSDAVDGSGTATCEPVSGSQFALGNTTVTCNATDTAGNAATPTTFVVHVVDTTKPVIASHDDVTAEATSAAGAMVTYTSPATSDAVDGPGTATCEPLSGSQFALGDTTVTCNATDAAGNAATPTSFNVKVVDTTAPEVTVPSNMTVPATDESGAIVTFSASAIDIVDGDITPTCNPISGSLFTVGSTTVTCSATDKAGNTDTASFTITVTNTAPVPLSQLTTAKVTCSQFASGDAPELPRLLYTPTYNKKTGEDVIKSVAPSTFLYYVKAILPTEASTLVIAQENDKFFPAMLASVTLYDVNCARLSPLLATTAISGGDITISYAPGEADRVVYVGVKYSARPIVGQIVTGGLNIYYSFSAALDDAAAYTSNDLPITFIQ